MDCLIAVHLQNIDLISLNNIKRELFNDAMLSTVFLQYNFFFKIVVRLQWCAIAGTQTE
jgi:hypothetical protein